MRVSINEGFDEVVRKHKIEELVQAVVCRHGGIVSEEPDGTFVVEGVAREALEEIANERNIALAIL